MAIFTVFESKAASSVANRTQQDTYSFDIEQKALDGTHLLNTTVQNFIWQNITVTVKDNKTKLPKAILDNVSGIVEAGQLAFNHLHVCRTQVDIL